MYFRAHLQANTMWMNAFNRMSYWSIRLLEAIFSSSKAMPCPIPAIWQGTVCKPVISTLKVGHPDPLIYPIKHFFARVHHLYPFPAATLPLLEHWLVKQCKGNTQGDTHSRILLWACAISSQNALIKGVITIKHVDLQFKKKSGFLFISLC